VWFWSVVVQLLILGISPGLDQDLDLSGSGGWVLYTASL
jgi:hypothetical protein